MGSRPGVWRLIRNYRFNSIFVRTYSLILALAVVPLAGVAVYFSQYFQRVATEQLVSVSELEAHQVRASFDQAVLQIYQLIGDMGTHHLVLRFMSAESGTLGNEERYFLYEDINRELLHPFRATPLVRTINLVSFSARLRISSQAGLRLAGEQEIISGLATLVQENPGRVGWFGLRRETYPYEEDYLTLFWRLPPHTRELLGVVYVEFETDAVRRMLSPDTSELYTVLLVDERGTVLHAANPEHVGQRFAELTSMEESTGSGHNSLFANWEGREAVVSRSSSRFGVDIVGIRTLSTLAAEFAEARTTIVGFVVVVAVLGMIVAFMIAVRAFQPIMKVFDLVSGDTDLPPLTVQSNRQDELRYITRAIGEVVTERNEAAAELKRRVAALRRAQQIALQAQINPHFLYNTLETIRWKAMGMSGGENETSRLITKLSGLLRAALETSEELIAIRDEVEHAALYAELQQARYGEQFTIEWDVDPPVARCLLPRFSIQPLIENALYHGVKPAGRPCAIAVRARRRGDNVVVLVEDDGVGMPEAEIEQLNHDLVGFTEIEGEHIGLRNVNQRARLLFGDAYGVSVFSGSSSGCGRGITVELVIPSETGKNPANESKNEQYRSDPVNS